MHVLLSNGCPVKFLDSSFNPHHPGLEVAGLEYDEAVGRWELHDMTFEKVESLARGVTELMGALHVATFTEGQSPRHDIIRVPRVGDEVSYSFNGDSTPDGVIVRVTEKFKVVTSTGNEYRRKKNTGSWVRTGGTWSLIYGHVTERNPHF